MKTNSLIVKDSGIHVSDGEVTVICQDQEQAAKLLLVKHCIFPKELKDIEGPYPIPGLRFVIRTCREHCSQVCAENGCEAEVAILSAEEETKEISKPLREHFEMETDAGTTLRTFDYIRALENYIESLETTRK